MTIRTSTRLSIVCALLCALAAAGCSSKSSSPPSHDGGGNHDQPTTPGKPVAISLSKKDTSELDALDQQLAATKTLSADELLAKRAVEHGPALSYDPKAATGLDLIQASTVKLDGTEQDLLGKNGFVVSARKQFPTMLYGYDTLYQADLPVYVSADSILDAVHRSYDRMLANVELGVLVPELDALLDGMRSQLKKRTPQNAATKDADFFLAVAKSLLDGKPAAPVLNAQASEVNSFVTMAVAADGHTAREIFGSQRDIDFSQFQPRGHYNNLEELQRYFRAMMWLGRIDLRLIETQSDGKQVFRREQLNAMLLLRDLVDSARMERWKRIDSTVETFVGKSDYMRLPEVDALLAQLGAKDDAALAKLSDETIAQAILDGGYGAQLIASQLIVNGTADGHTLPLDRSFALFGQRYTVDSHVFSNVVYDRTPNRFMPNPLDAAYAAFGNDQAVALLAPELKKYGYAPQLESTRLLIDAHGDDYWKQNLYNLWLGSLRALSPAAGKDAEKANAGLPEVMLGDNWGRRVLTTQLASWAQLRHDTILYVKQSYTSGASCEFPDAYVDPYPEFFSALITFAERGTALADVLAGGQSSPSTMLVTKYFENLKRAMTTLHDMAVAEREGTPFTAEQMKFINQLVRSEPGGCAGPPGYSGWYAGLFYGYYDDMDGNHHISEIDFDPTIADVHTQPTDEAGNDVGRILHVGTGAARLMVVTVDACDGAHAYAGVVSSYYERITEDWKRTTDQEWSEELSGGQKQLPEVEWAKPYVAGAL